MHSHLHLRGTEHPTTADVGGGDEHEHTADDDAKNEGSARLEHRNSDQAMPVASRKRRRLGTSAGKLAASSTDGRDGAPTAAGES